MISEKKPVFLSTLANLIFLFFLSCGGKKEGVEVKFVEKTPEPRQVILLFQGKCDHVSFVINDLEFAGNPIDGLENVFLFSQKINFGKHDETSVVVKGNFKEDAKNAEYIMAVILDSTFVLVDSGKSSKDLSFFDSKSKRFESKMETFRTDPADLWVMTKFKDNAGINKCEINADQFTEKYKSFTTSYGKYIKIKSDTLTPGLTIQGISFTDWDLQMTFGDTIIKRTGTLDADHPPVNEPLQLGKIIVHRKFLGIKKKNNIAASN